MSAFKEMIQPKMSPEVKQELKDAIIKLGLSPSIMNNPTLVEFVNNVRKEMK